MIIKEKGKYNMILYEILYCIETVLNVRQFPESSPSESCLQRFWFLFGVLALVANRSVSIFPNSKLGRPK